MEVTMTKYYIVCLIVSFFCAVSFDMCAMDENTKRKEHPEHNAFEEPDFKKMRLSVLEKKYEEEKNLLDERINCLKKFTTFPVVIDRHTHMPWQSLDPNDLYNTEEFKKIAALTQFEKNNVLINNAWYVSYKSYGQYHTEHIDGYYAESHRKRRFFVACALLAGADCSLVVQDFLEHMVGISDYWLVYIFVLCGADIKRNYWSLLSYARTQEMADLLLSAGGDTSPLKCDLLKNCIRRLDYRMLKFFGELGARWDDYEFTLQDILVDTKYPDSIEDHLRTLKVIFSLGYHSVDEKLKKLDGFIRITQLHNQELVRQKKLLAKALDDQYFSLERYLYQLDRNKTNYLWDEQRVMYKFGITANQPDLSINYL